MQTISTFLSEDDFFKHMDQLMTQVNIFCTAGSGWVIERLVSLDVKMNKYNPTRIGSFIPTPQPVEKLRQCLLNVKNTNDNNNCFMYCVAAALFPVKRNAEHPAQYRKHFKRFVFDPKSMPMPLSIIPRFETANNLSILVYAYENSQIYPIYITKNTEATKLIHFMTITDEEKSHYSLKKNMDCGQSMRGDQESDNERRRRRKNPFIDDEAVECSDDEAAVESSSSSGTSSIVIKTKRQKTHLIWTYSSSDDSDE